jgi:hypothetical protein
MNSLYLMIVKSKHVNKPFDRRDQYKLSIDHTMTSLSHRTMRAIKYKCQCDGCMEQLAEYKKKDAKLRVDSWLCMKTSFSGSCLGSVKHDTRHH